MDQILPVILRGDHLGQRHRYFNLQVNQLITDQVSFEDIEALPERSALDRLLKIDLANKLQKVDYILNTLKDDDMLYVSRALKYKWLLERWDVINTKHLEKALYPEMVLPAISKIKHWLYINLRDPVSCKEFYLYYKYIKFDFAIKFLIHCDNEFVLKEFPELLIQITPHHLKILGEKDPKLLKLYFDTLATNSDLVEKYIAAEKSFYNSIKCILKLNPDIYLDIVEKYHNIDRFTKLSPSATDYILRCRKNRFMAKPELYVAHLLHIPTIARRLSVEECKEIVLQLARAVYLSKWFSYKNVEPLIKRVERKSRSAFKKRVFVEKDIGETVAECPYEFPGSPAYNSDKYHVFCDTSYRPILMDKFLDFRAMLRKRKYAKWGESKSKYCTIDSELQKLFNEFRFVGFESTLQDLKNRVPITSSADRRRDMLLVLVSKSGGRVESVHALLQLALRLRNEPVHVRAAVVRSLVKRASIWRVPDDTWTTLLEYAVGLGLDGTKPEAECREGLHAVVLRQLLTTGDCDSAVRTAFLGKFSTLLEYNLSSIEREKVGISLHHILLAVADNTDSKVTASYLNQLLGVMDKYRINFETSPAVSAIAQLAERDPDSARPLLKHLYKARVGRRQLLRQYLEFRHDDASLVNALRHDIKVVEPNWIIKLLINGETQANQFLLKLSLYFSETGGMAEQMRAALEEKIEEDPTVRLARPLLTMTSGENVQMILSLKANIGDKHNKLPAALRANMHRSRPAPDALALGWRKVGLKAVAARVMRCRLNEVEHIIQTLLMEGTKRTVRLALALSLRTNCIFDIFTTAIKLRPQAVLRSALLYFRSYGDAADLRIWEIVKPTMTCLDLRHCKGLRFVLRKLEWVPKVYRPDYCASLYLALDSSDSSSDYFLIVLSESLPEVSDDLLDAVLLRMLENLSKENPESYPAIIIRYLMLSKSKQEQNTRFKAIGAPFLNKICGYRDAGSPLIHSFFTHNFIQITESLQYNLAFFDTKCQSCMFVIESVLTWLQNFLPKDKYFNWYVKIHATMLYFKAIRQSIKLNPDIFADSSRKMAEGVEIVGFAFGKYVVQEVEELKSKYFDSVVELYGNALTKYLDKYFQRNKSKSMLIVAITKGMLAEKVECGAILETHIRKAYCNYLEDSAGKKIKELLVVKEDQMAQFFIYANISM